MKKHIMTILLIVIFVAGLAVFLYPTVSDYVNSLHQSKAIAGYESSVGTMTVHDNSAAFEKARAYNEHLSQMRDPFAQAQEISDEYNETLDVTGTGIMGYLAIDKIGIKIPIYHSTSADVLQVAAGHFEGSSLPTGEKSTHAVLSAHRGLPSAKLFTDLDKMEIGDKFVISVLNKHMTYEVDQIVTVLPYEMDELRVDPEQDYVTLLTCTPYGINSHRLLIRGVRTEDDDTGKKPEKIRIVSEISRIDPMAVAFVMAGVMLFIGLVIVLIRTRRRK